MSERSVHQCMKCWHIWEVGVYLRSNGEDRTKCPNCNSTQTLVTEINPTKIVIKEDLLMFTDNKYPELYCPKTTLEELYGKQGYILHKEGVKIFISRGFSNPQNGHYIYLYVDRKLWMTTEKKEAESMQEAVKECPENARVFIAGLGLGLILLELAQSKKAREVIVVEREPRVIKFVEPIIRKWFEQHYATFNWKVLCGDAVEEVSKHGLFDWIFFDIWSDSIVSDKNEPDPESVLAKALSYRTVKGKVTVWTMVAMQIEDAKIDPEIKAKIDHMFDATKSQQL